MPAATDEEWMGRAIAAARRARFRSPPNPWVGAVIVNGSVAYDGHTAAPGGAHAERMAIELAGRDAAGATLYTTLEPCSHSGRTGPCTEAIIDAAVKRVVIGIEDPDPHVSGSGVAALQEAGIEVVVGVAAPQVEEQLAPYLHQRRTGRPWVVLKLAATMDGKTAAPDGTSQWITGAEARADGHRLRALSDGILVGAGTIRADNPHLTVRDFDPGEAMAPAEAMTRADVSPRRFVLGTAPADCNAQPLTELHGELPELLDRMGEHGILQLLVEGGAGVANAFHRGGFVNEYVLYLAPALFGGSGGAGLFSGAGAMTIADVWRGEIVDVARLGSDLRIRIRPSAG